MASRTCWLCKVRSQHNLVKDPVLSKNKDAWYAAFECTECHTMSIGRMPTMTGSYSSAAGEAIRTQPVEITWIPRAAEIVTFEDVPPLIGETATEAHGCHSIGAYRGATILARAAIEATAKHQEASGKNLFERIGSLAKAGVITSHTAEAAHEIRDSGNDAAHYNVVLSVSEEESSLVLELMEQVLREVYQQPARLAAAKAARAEREAQGAVESTHPA